MMTSRLTAIAMTTLVLPMLARCAPQDAGEEADAARAASGAVTGATSTPDTTAEALWAHVASEDYRANWTMWPGTDALYAGREPHGMLLTTYLNDLGLDAVTNKAGAMPAGAVVVKENYAPDSTLAAVTVMYKTDSYNPAHANWFFLKRLADGTVEAAGRVNGCQSCHGGRADNDYLFTGELN